MEKSIFISHKHEDKKIADVFKKNFQLWNVSLGNIFQSSDYRTSSVIGEPLKPQLREALANAVLVLLIYTDSDKDWEFCLWECGVATDPRDQQPTRIALFQSGEQLSRVFQDEVVFKLDNEEIRKFTEQFHKKAGFVYADKPFQEDVQADILQKRADDLYNDLSLLSIPGKREERYRWDHFTLDLLPAQTENVRSEVNPEKRIELLIQESRVVHSFGQALLHFNYTTGTKDLTFKKLINRWKEYWNNEGDVPQGWIREICEEMNRAINNIPAKPAWQLMRSVVYENWWFYPIVNHARVLPNGGVEFDIYMYRFPGALPSDIKIDDK